MNLTKESKRLLEVRGFDSMLNEWEALLESGRKIEILLDKSKYTKILKGQFARGDILKLAFADNILTTKNGVKWSQIIITHKRQKTV